PLSHFETAACVTPKCVPKSACLNPSFLRSAVTRWAHSGGVTVDPLRILTNSLGLYNLRLCQPLLCPQYNARASMTSYSEGSCIPQIWVYDGTHRDTMKRLATVRNASQRTLMPVMIEGKRYYSAAEIAKTLGISRTTFWRWRRSRTEANIPVGRRYRGGKM